MKGGNHQGVDDVLSSGEGWKEGMQKEECMMSCVVLCCIGLDCIRLSCDVLWCVGREKKII